MKTTHSTLFVFFSEILNRPVLDAQGRTVGRLHDIIMRIGDEVHPRATKLVIRRGGIGRVYAHLDWSRVERIEDDIGISAGQEELEFVRAAPRLEFSLCRDVLDQQVVDTDNQKVVRVNDIHLLKVDNQLYLAHVDVGLRALVRRLEWDGFIDAVLRFYVPDSPYLRSEEFIPWKNTQVLTLGRSRNVLRLDVSRQKLSQIPPTKLAEIMEDLDVFEKYSLFKAFDFELQKKVFADLSTAEQEEVLDRMTLKEASHLLENIPSDEAADLLLRLPKEKTRQLMKSMETKTSKRLRKLLGFSQDSAGGLMATEYLSLPKDALVADAIQLIKEHVNFPGNVYHVYIVDENDHLLGSTSIRRFIDADPRTPIVRTCFPKKIFVRTDDGMEEIALLLERYKFSSIPVLDEDDVLQGVVTIDDVMEELISLAWSKYKERL